MVYSCYLLDLKGKIGFSDILQARLQVKVNGETWYKCIENMLETPPNACKCLSGYSTHHVCTFRITSTITAISKILRISKIVSGT